MVQPFDGDGSVIVNGNGEPVADDVVRKEVESHGWEDAILDLATDRLYGWAAIALLVWDNLLTLPEMFKELDEVVANAIFMECLKEARVVNGVVGFVKVQVDLEEWCLPKACKLLLKLALRMAMLVPHWAMKP